MDVMHKAQESFEQAQQEVIRAQTDLENFMQEALLPVLAAPQVNVSLCKTLETLTRLVETVWNPQWKAATRTPGPSNPVSKAILPTSSISWVRKQVQRWTQSKMQTS